MGYNCDVQKTTTPSRHVGVYGFIVNTDNRFLLVKRNKNDSMPGLWEFPGGSIEHGEHPEDAVRREVKEETNLDIDVPFPLTVLSSTPVNRQYIRIVYLCRLTSDNQSVVLSDEHTDHVWLSTDEFYEEKKTEFSKDIYLQVKENTFIWLAVKHFHDQTHNRT